MTSPVISVVIPNWNGRELLAGCLDALRDQRGAPGFEIVVVDNGSKDGSAEWLARERPEVRVVALPENLGFAGGVNVGIRAAQGEFIALLNNDARPEPTWLASLHRALASHPEFSGAGSKLVKPAREWVIDSAGDAVTRSGFPFKRGEGLPERGRFEVEEEVASICAGAALYRRSALEDVGLLEEKFFAYCEDADWCLRARLRGHRFLYVPTARVEHLTSATADRVRPLAERWRVRNSLYLALRNLPGPLLVREIPGLVRDRALVFARAVVCGTLRPTVAGHVDVLRNLGWVLESRKAIQGARRISPQAFATGLAPRPPVDWMVRRLRERWRQRRRARSGVKGG